VILRFRRLQLGGALPEPIAQLLDDVIATFASSALVFCADSATSSRFLSVSFSSSSSLTRVSDAFS